MLVLNTIAHHTHLTHFTLFLVLQYFGSIKNLGLGAEHGFYYKWPREEELPFSGTLIVLLLFCCFLAVLCVWCASYGV